MRFNRILTALLPVAVSLGAGACSFDINKWFERDDPQVEQARAALEAGADGSEELHSARLALEEVLRFRCEGDGGQDLVLDRPGAALDLGLVIFRLSELIGRRFGDEELRDDGGSSEGEELVMSARAKQLECAHLLLMKVATDPRTPEGLALRARYLLGNLAFLTRRYKDAVARYDEVLLRHPARGNDPATDAGPPADDDAVARYAAWNRAIALERLLPPDSGDAGDDSDANDASDGNNDSDDAGDGTSDGDAGTDGDSGNDGADGHDGSNDGPPDTGDGGGGGDTAPDNGTNTGNDGGSDGGGQDTAPMQPPPSPSTSASAAPMPSSSVTVDLRELDRFNQKAPLDLDFKARLREKRKIPKKYDK